MTLLPFSIDTFGAFLLTCLIIEFTPGPNMAYLAVLSAADGRRAGFSAVAGIALGLLLVGLAAAFGVSTIVTNSAFAYEALRWGGVAYLLWLAWDGWRDATVNSPARTGHSETDSTYFTRGLITNLLNPKAAVFYVAVLPTFVTAGDNTLSQSLTLSIAYVLVATAVHTLIVGLAGAAQPFLEDPDRNRTVRRVLSVALALVALWFAISTAR